MATMPNTEAKTIIWEMFDSAIKDVASFKRRIAELEEDFNADPSPDTAAQIKRTKGRLERRIKEGAALAIAATQFPSE
jgi:3-phenylpropionate/cinnamic acid dioxygenase small subunit